MPQFGHDSSPTQRLSLLPRKFSKIRGTNTGGYHNSISYEVNALLYPLSWIGPEEVGVAVTRFIQFLLFRRRDAFLAGIDRKHR